MRNVNPCLGVIGDVAHLPVPFVTLLLLVRLVHRDVALVTPLLVLVVAGHHVIVHCLLHHHHLLDAGSTRVISCSIGKNVPGGGDISGVNSIVVVRMTNQISLLSLN